MALIGKKSLKKFGKVDTKRKSIMALVDDILVYKRSLDGKKTDWQVKAGMKKIAEHEDDRVKEMLYVVNVAMYCANVPLAGRKAAVGALRSYADRIDRDMKDVMKDVMDDI